MGAFAGPTVASDGLILLLDAANLRSYPGSGSTWFDISGSNNHFSLFNSPTFSSGSFAFNGTNQYAASAANINLTTFDSVTVIIAIRATALGVWPTMAFEHTPNYNTNPGGFGISINSSGSAAVTDLVHTNHFSSSNITRNYYASGMGTNWRIHANVFSSIADATGRIAYSNGQQQPFTADSGGYPTTTVTPAGNFANSIMYLCSRGGASGWQPAQLGYFSVYNRKLSPVEIDQQFNALRGRFYL